MAPRHTDTPEEAPPRAPLIAMGICLAIALAGFLSWATYALQGRDGADLAPAGSEASQLAE